MNSGNLVTACARFAFRFAPDKVDIAVGCALIACEVEKDRMPTDLAAAACFQADRRQQLNSLNDT